MMEETFKSRKDFLTMLLQDELFQGKDEDMVEECLTFMIAANSTTAMLIINTIYNLAKYEDKANILRAEVRKSIEEDSSKKITSFTDDDWISHLLTNEVV
jgi:cytochrome P450